MTLSYELTEEDQIAYNLWLGDRLLLKKPLIHLFTAIYSLFALLIGVSSLVIGLTNGQVAEILIGLLCLLFSVLAAPIPALRRRWRQALIRHNLRRSSVLLQRYLGSRTTSIETGGLRVVGRPGELLLAWEGLNHAATETLDIFHVVPQNAIVIPRTAFSGEAHRTAFLAEVEKLRGRPTGQPTHGTWWTQGASLVQSEEQQDQRRS